MTFTAATIAIGCCARSYQRVRVPPLRMCTRISRLESQDAYIRARALALVYAASCAVRTLRMDRGSSRK